MNSRTDTPTDVCTEAYNNHFHKIPAVVGIDLWRRIWNKALASVSPRFAAAAVTLLHLGYTWEGGELWKPPIGKAKKHCEVPPQGWECTRTPGHGGPCAAKPATKADPLGERVLSPGEQRALLEHPDALEILADWHDAQQAEAESIGFDSEGDKRRADELRARADAIVAADPDLWPIDEDADSLKVQLGMCQHALLQVRKALGLGLHSEDDLLEVIKRLRDGRGLLEQSNRWLKSTTPDDLAKEIEDYLEETR